MSFVTVIFVSTAFFSDKTCFCLSSISILFLYVRLSFSLRVCVLSISDGTTGGCVSLSTSLLSGLWVVSGLDTTGLFPCAGELCVRCASPPPLRRRPFPTSMWCVHAWFCSLLVPRVSFSDGSDSVRRGVGDAGCGRLSLLSAFGAVYLSSRCLRCSLRQLVLPSLPRRPTRSTGLTVCLRPPPRTVRRTSCVPLRRVPCIRSPLAPRRDVQCGSINLLPRSSCIPSEFCS